MSHVGVVFCYTYFSSNCNSHGILKVLYIILCVRKVLFFDRPQILENMYLINEPVHKSFNRLLLIEIIWELDTTF